MTVEIRELVIRAEVDPESKPRRRNKRKSEATVPPPLNADDLARLLADRQER